MHSELLARLEAATGPDRLLDFDIARQVLGRSIGVAKYTASIDAALTLVPRGWGMDLRLPSGGHLEKFGVATPIFAHCRLHNLPLDVDAVAATPALAIVIAALRAKGDA